MQIYLYLLAGNSSTTLLLNVQACFFFHRVRWVTLLNSFIVYWRYDVYALLHVLFNHVQHQMIFGVRVLNNELPPAVTILLKWSWTVPVHIPLWNRLLLFSSLSQKARHFTGVPIPFLHSDKTAIILWTFLFTQPGEKGKVKEKEEEDRERFLPWGEPGLTSVWRAFLWAVKRSLTFYQMEAHSCVLLE